MRAALKAIATHLQSSLDALPGQTITVHRHDAVGVAAPYVVLTVPPHPIRGEQLGGPTAAEVSGTLIATSVHVSVDGALWVADRVREALSPNMRGTRVPLAGSVIEVMWSGALGDAVIDRDVRLPNTNTNPGVAIEGYTFAAQPA